jgi:hypothetical protein
VVDQQGKISFNQAAYIQASLSGPASSAQLKGNVFADIVDGIAAFTDLSITEEGEGFSLKLYAPSLGKYIETPRFSVLPPVRALRVASPLPAVVKSGHPIGIFDDQTGAPLAVPSVYLLDEDKHYAALSSRPVTVSAIGPEGTSLSGHTEVLASSGIASFHSIYLTKAGNYSLVFSIGRFSVVSTSVITVIAGRAAYLAIEQQPCALPCDGLAGNTRSQVLPRPFPVLLLRRCFCVCCLLGIFATARNCACL